MRLLSGKESLVTEATCDCTVISWQFRVLGDGMRLLRTQIGVLPITHMMEGHWPTFLVRTAGWSRLVSLKLSS